MADMHRPRTLRSRLFSWFFGAILLAILTGALVVIGTRPEPITGAEVMARNVGARLAATWDEPEATRAYVGEVRDVTGFDVRLVRDPRKLGRRACTTRPARGAAIVPENPQHIFIPVVRERSAGRRARDGEVRAPPRAVAVVAARPRARPRRDGALAHGGTRGQPARAAPRAARACVRPLRRRRPRVPGGPRARRIDGSPSRCARWPCASTAWPTASRRWCAASASSSAPSATSSGRPSGARASRSRSRATACPPDAPAERSPARALDDVEKQLVAVDGILGDLLDVTRAGLADLRKETRPFVDWLRARVAEEPAPPAVVDRRGARRRGPRAAVRRRAPRPRRAQPARQRARPRPPRRAPRSRCTSRARAATVRVVVRDRGRRLSSRLRRPRLRALRPRRRGPRAPHGRRGLRPRPGHRPAHRRGPRRHARSRATPTGGGAEVGFELPPRLRPATS